jgi:hypothetical protein
MRVFENRVLTRIFGPEREREREEVTDGWGKLHNQKCHKMYSSRNIIRVIKSRRMSEHVVGLRIQGTIRNTYIHLRRKKCGEETTSET